MNTPMKSTSVDAAPSQSIAVRKPYVSPVFRVHGDFAALTQSGGKGIFDGMGGASILF